MGSALRPNRQAHDLLRPTAPRCSDSAPVDSGQATPAGGRVERGVEGTWVEDSSLKSIRSM